MKGNVFSQWLKEFCALVFTQTVQAFILAIILTLVVISIAETNGAEASTRNSAAGVLAIVALTSISKMEGLVKKLFGIESSVTDSSMNGGKGGMLGALMALKMMKSAGDNIPKVGKGIMGRVRAGRDLKNARLGMLASKARELERYNQLHPGASAATSGSSAGGPTGGGPVGGSGAGNSASGSGARNTAGGSSTGNVAQAASNSQSNKDREKQLKARFKLEDDLKKIESDYNSKKEELEKNRRTANRQILSGITETGGAIAGAALGGAAGAVIAAGTGDSVLDKTAKGIGMGIGYGDKLGQGIVEIPGTLDDIGRETSESRKKLKGYKEKVKEYNRKIEEEMRKFDAGDI